MENKNDSEQIRFFAEGFCPNLLKYLNTLKLKYLLKIMPILCKYL